MYDHQLHVLIDQIIREEHLDTGGADSLFRYLALGEVNIARARVLKGTKETARLIGDTSADRIRGALKSAL